MTSRCAVTVFYRSFQPLIPYNPFNSLYPYLPTPTFLLYLPTPTFFSTPSPTPVFQKPYDFKTLSGQSSLSASFEGSFVATLSSPHHSTHALHSTHHKPYGLAMMNQGFRSTSRDDVGGSIGGAGASRTLVHGATTNQTANSQHNSSHSPSRTNLHNTATNTTTSLRSNTATSDLSLSRDASRDASRENTNSSPTLNDSHDEAGDNITGKDPT